MEYIRSLNEESGDGCFICRYAADPDADRGNHVIWRGTSCMTFFNSFPYSSGHLLIAPMSHLADLDDLDDAVFDELFRQVRDAKRLCAATFRPQGFNVGMNFGRCAGAGLPGHLHVHVVPRWEGDTNFVPLLSDTRVIPESIAAQHEQMRVAAAAAGLPQVRGG